MTNIEITRPEITIHNRLIEFCNDSLRHVSGMYMAWLFVALNLSLAIYLASPRDAATPGLFFYYIILLIHLIMRLKHGKANILAPDIIFLLFYTMFHLGYITLYALGQSPYSDEVFYFQNSIAKGLLIVNLGLLGFIFGFEVTGIGKNAFIGQKTFKIPPKSWCTVGLFLMVVALAMHLLGLTLIGPWRFMEYGRVALNAEKMIDIWPAGPLIDRSKYLLVIGLVLYLIASALRHGKLFNSKIALGVSIAFLIIFILEGHRGSIVKLIAPILMVQHYLIKPIKIRYLALVFVALLFLGAAMAAVRTIAFDPARMLQEFYAKKSAGLLGWQSPFLETGGSFLIVNIVAGDVPGNTPYWMGQSWAAAVLHFVPGLYGYFYRQGWIYTSPSEWITYTYWGRDASGRAFTVVAEGYLNFGLIGAFAELMLCGMFIRWLTTKFSTNPSGMWAFIMLGCLGVMLQIVRNHLYTVSDICLQIFIAGALLNLFFGGGQEMDLYEADEFSELKRN